MIDLRRRFLFELVVSVTLVLLFLLSFVGVFFLAATLGVGEVYAILIAVGVVGTIHIAARMASTELVRMMDAPE